jgi:predicted nuclease with RNAse H fold
MTERADGSPDLRPVLRTLRRPTGSRLTYEREALVGVDLAGSPRRATGLCLLRSDGRCRTAVLFTDHEIFEAIRSAAPALVGIDAPLSLPRGRRTLSDRSAPHFRSCDLELRARRIPFFPMTLGPMRMLTRRGIRLRRRLENAGVRVIETYPGGAQDVWGMPRKQRGVERLRRALRRAGLYGDVEHRNVSHDELDAATAALVATFHLLGRTEIVGDPAEGQIVLPRADGPRRRPSSASSFGTTVAALSGGNPGPPAGSTPRPGPHRRTSGPVPVVRWQATHTPDRG